MKIDEAYWATGDARVYVVVEGKLLWFLETVGREVEEGDLHEVETPLNVDAFVKAKRLERVSDAIGGNTCLRTWGLAKTTEAQRRASAKWDAGMVQVKVKLDPERDRDVLDRLDGLDTSRVDYIRRLVRADIAENPPS